MPDDVHARPVAVTRIRLKQLEHPLIAGASFTDKCVRHGVRQVRISDRHRIGVAVRSLPYLG